MKKKKETLPTETQWLAPSRFIPPPPAAATHRRPQTSPPGRSALSPSHHQKRREEKGEQVSRRPWRSQIHPSTWASTEVGSIPTTARELERPGQNRRRGRANPYLLSGGGQRRIRAVVKGLHSTEDASAAAVIQGRLSWISSSSLPFPSQRVWQS